MSYGDHTSLNPGHNITLGDLRQFLAEHGDIPDDSELLATVRRLDWDETKSTNPRGRITRLTIRHKPVPVVDENSRYDGIVTSITFEQIDEIAERQGFGPALRTIADGWKERRHELLTQLATAMRRVVAPLQEDEWDDQAAFTCCYEPTGRGGFRRTCGDCQHRHHRFEEVIG